MCLRRVWESIIPLDTQDQWLWLGISVHSCHVLTNPLADLLKGIVHPGLKYIAHLLLSTGGSGEFYRGRKKILANINTIEIPWWPCAPM